MRRVRTPWFPRYADAQNLLRVLDGVPANLYKRMYQSIWDQRGTPQRPTDWKHPDQWIGERLFASEADLARQIWEGSDRTLNPRHIRGPEFLLRRYSLLEETGGQLRRSSRGDAFVANEAWILQEIDEAEGVGQILCLLSQRDGATRAELFPAWQRYCQAYSEYNSDRSVADTLWRRLNNLIDRGLVDHASPVYRITPDGREYARHFTFAEPVAPPAPDKIKPKASFVDAARQVLEEVAKQQPMHYRDITRHVQRLGLVDSDGKTPEATLYTQLSTEISRATKRGDTPVFVRYGKGYFGLSQWMKHGLAYQIEQHNREVRQQLRESLHEMDPSKFQELIGRLLGALGFVEVEVTGRSGDGGIDVRGTLVVGDVIRTNMAVQVKRWKNNVQVSTIREVRGSLGTHDQGMIVTTSDFGSGARDEAMQPNKIPVALMNGDQLVALLAEYQIGVRRTQHELLELGDPEEDD